jgi:hypothetical protein
LFSPAQIIRGLLLQPAAYRGVAARRSWSIPLSLLFVLSIYGFLAIWATWWVQGASGAGLEAAGAFATWGLLRWMVVAPILWFVGVHGFEGEGTLGAMYRATALAHAPLLLQVVPLDANLTNFVAGFWFLAALIVATHAVLGLSARRAAGTGVMAAAGLLIVSNVFLVPIAIFGVL